MTHLLIKKILAFCALAAISAAPAEADAPRPNIIVILCDDLGCADIGFNGFSIVGARRDQWKISRRGPNSPWRLFNLELDIGESKDLSGEHPERVKEMGSEAGEWSRSHVEPRWFDNLNAAKIWKDKGMPNYEKTFRVK